MMQKEHAKLTKAIIKSSKGINKIRETLHGLLSRSDKVFKLTIDGEVFDFQPAFTEEEYLKMFLLREKCIKALLIKSVETMFIPEREDPWSTILALSMGVDPRDYQFEKYEVSQEDVGEMSENDLNAAIDRDTIEDSKDKDDNWYMKQQLTEGARWHNPVTGGKFEVVEEENV